MLRYLATAALPPGQAVNEELIASIAPMLDQVGSVFGEVRVRVRVGSGVWVRGM